MIADIYLHLVYLLLQDRQHNLKHWMFLSCSSNLHLQPLRDLRLFNGTVQSKLNAQYYSKPPIAVVFYIYTHT